MPQPRGQLPSALRPHARWVRFGVDQSIPVMLVHPDSHLEQRVPVVIWMHGRTVNKELDPGRYLRWMRAGIGACAVDLPGHGERFDAKSQEPEHTYQVILRMAEEIDEVVDSLSRDHPEFDQDRMAIGGMSAGGMATILRLCDPHPFICASVESTTGSWEHQRHRPMFKEIDDAEIDARNPMNRIDDWRDIPFQAIHTRGDQWVDYEGQREFVDALRSRYADPDRIELITYEDTGAPFEHAGFGRHSSDAKARQVEFLRRFLLRRENREQ